MAMLRNLGGASYLYVSWPYGIEMYSVYSIIQETIHVLPSKLCYIKFPTTEEECREESEKF